MWKGCEVMKKMKMIKYEKDEKRKMIKYLNNEKDENDKVLE